MGKKKIEIRFVIDKLRPMFEIVSEQIGIGDACLDSSLKNIEKSGRYDKKTIQKMKKEGNLSQGDYVSMMDKQMKRQCYTQNKLITAKEKIALKTLEEGEPKVELCG